MGLGFLQAVFAGRGRRGPTRAAPDASNQAQALPQTYPIDFDTALEALGGFQAWLSGRRREPRQICEHDLSSLASLQESTPEQCGEVLDAARTIMLHRFDLLGSGPYRPIDPSRPEDEGYTPIDWFLDPVRNLRFPSNVSHKDWDLYAMRPGNADVKYPWELARCQHFLPLAQAFLVSGEERFAAEVLNQCEDFIEANPTGIGINWTCTMDVSIRALNWCLALCLIKDAVAADEARMRPHPL